jgi:hypothetical protein
LSRLGLAASRNFLASYCEVDLAAPLAVKVGLGWITASAQASKERLVFPPVSDTWPTGLEQSLAVDAPGAPA